MLQNEDVDFSAYVGAVEASEKTQTQQTANRKGFKVPDCCAINDKAIVRFVNGIAETALDQGKPGSGRAKLFNIAWVKDDAGKAFFLVLPAIINNKPMYKSLIVDFIDKVLTRTWIENPNAKEGEPTGAWRYFYADRDDYGQQQSGTKTLKQIYWNVMKSGIQAADVTPDKYQKQRSWRGQTIYVANVIDRYDYKWHQENKKTKLLMRYVNVTTDKVTRKEVSFFAMGAPLKELTDNHGIGLDYDVLIVPGKKGTDKFTLKNVSKLKEINYWDEVKTLITEADKQVISPVKGFTDEEKTWNPIDIDEFYRLTSCKTFLEHFGKTVKAFDLMTGTNFYEQFEEEAKAEAKAAGKEYKPAQETATAATAQAAAPTQAAPAATQAQTAPVNQPAATAAPAQSAPVTQTAPAQTAPSFDTMSPAGVPADVAPSAEAKKNIDDFYDSLDDDE